MKNIKIIIIFLTNILFINHFNATTGTNIENVYKTIFLNSMYTNQQKVALINKTLNDNSIPDEDRNTLRNLKMIIDIFVKPQDKITVNSILYRTPKESIMHWAAKLDQAHLMKQLITYGAKIDPINQWGKTPLHYAAQWNSPATAQLLLNNGANTSAKDQYNKTPLDYAQEYRNKKVLTVLNRQTKKITAQADNICQASVTEQEINQLKSIENPHIALEITYSTLFNCKKYNPKNKLAVIEIILTRSDISQNDRNTLQKLKMIIPLKKNIDANTVLAKSSKETIMHWAAQLNLVHLMKILIKLGANLNPLDNKKKTPLHYAAESNSPEAADLLLSLGANPMQQDSNKKSALDYAQNNKNVLQKMKNYIPNEKKEPQKKLQQKSKSAPTLKNSSNNQKQKSTLKRQKSF